MTSTPLETLLVNLPRPLKGVLHEQLDLAESFVDLASRFADEPGTTALLSGGSLDSARYHILGIRPWLTLREGGGKVVVECGGSKVSVPLDPFDALDALMKRYSLPGAETAPPLSAGLLGYLAYDLKDCLEVLPRTSCDDLHLPRLYMAAPSILVVHDRQKKTTTVHVPILEDGEQAAQARLTRFRQELGQPRPTRSANRSVGELTSGLSRSEYIDAVEAVRDYIVRGHVYQVNMSQRFETTFSGDTFALFADLFQVNPAPFFAFVQAGDHQMVSTSPERFIQLAGQAVETRPIKGTRPRGPTPELDQAMRHELETSRKDDAELSMIVDLLRNDIGKVCAAQSVRVIEHKRVEAYENVYHLVSVVVGRLDDDKNMVDLIKATFPGGSITGCPKIRSMEIIDELEPVRRHLYTGSIGFLGFQGTMDLSIAIRTATISGGRLVFSVGGGVVFDSKGGDEFEETLHKGRTLMRALQHTPEPSATAERFGWHNGMFKRLADMTVSVEDEGFAYGYGFFETMRVQNGLILRLDSHLARLRKAWDQFIGAPFPDITWRDVIDLVIAKNDLGDKVAAVKLAVAAGKPGASERGPNLIVTAREYRHRLAGTGRPGLRLAVYPHGWQTMLAGHKTMNYMFQRTAGHWARGQQADEALLLNADGSVAETNTANLLCRLGDQWVRPQSAHALPGTMEQAALALLAKQGISVQTRRLVVDDLKTSQALVVTNALMGAVPVMALDGRPVPTDESFCQRLNDALLVA
jgi:para-aminobenzoate synthetase component I